jgi:hypothetical protein
VLRRGQGASGTRFVKGGGCYATWQMRGVATPCHNRGDRARHRVGPAAQRCLERYGIDTRSVTVRPSVQRTQAQGPAHGSKGRHNERRRQRSPRGAPRRGRVTLRPALRRRLLSGALAHTLYTRPWWRYRSSWACSYQCCCWLCFTGCHRACGYRSRWWACEFRKWLAQVLEPSTSVGSAARGHARGIRASWVRQ